MGETTIGEVDKGYFAAMRFLFEMIGALSSHCAGRGSGGQFSGQRLLRRLGLPENPRWTIQLRKFTKWNLWRMRAIP
jgi:hypothetical protein